MNKTTYKKLVKHFGSARKMALALGIKPQAITQWKARGIPATRVLELEKMTGGAVTRYEMRPDVFGRKA